jgi:two-component system cell cycle response regulator DivK
MDKPRVLVVDDSVPNLELAAFLLGENGFDVAKALDALEARAQLSAFKPQLVLMDIQMPKVDGLTATRQIKANPATADVIVVAFTAYAMKDDELKMLAAGCDGYISKPIDVAGFAAQVRGFLEGPGSSAAR